MAKKKNLTQNEAAVVSKKAAYLQNGENLKSQSPAFTRYIGSMQKMYAGIPFWVITILVTVLAVLQALDVLSMATAAPIYGVLQAIPLIFVLATAVLMWRAVFHAKKKSDHYYPIKGMLGKIMLCFILFLVSAIAVSFVTSGFGSYLGLIFEKIGMSSLSDFMTEVDWKFYNAFYMGESLGDVTLDTSFTQLNSAVSAVSDGKLETLLMGVIFGLIVLVIILVVRSIQILKAIAASRNSVEYEEKVGDARITGKQMAIYGVVALVFALLVYLLDPMLSSMNFVSTGFNFLYESIATLSFTDGSKLVFMSLSEIPEQQAILSVPMVLFAMIGLVVFALVQAYRTIVLSSAFAKINASLKTGLVPKIGLKLVGIVSIVMALFMMVNGVTWCAAFFFSRVGGLSLLTAIGKVMLIAIVMLIVGTLLLKNHNEVKVCYLTQCKEQKRELPKAKKEFHWTLGKALLATAGCVVAWLGAYWLMSTLDAAGSLVLQVLSVLGSYDTDMLGGSLMNEILYTLIQLSDQAQNLISNLNQMALRAGLIVAAVAWMLSRNRFYKPGFSPEATQKLSGGSLIAPKILLILFAVVSGILTVGQLFMEGAWAAEVLTMISSAFDMMILMGLTMFFLRQARCGKAAKLLIPVAVGVVSKLLFTLLFEMSLVDILALENGVELMVSILVTTLVFQLVRWLFASTYYQETNNLIPVVVFDFLLTMMMSIVAHNISGLSVSEEVSDFLPALMVELFKALAETMQTSAGEFTKILPLLINLVVIALGVISMLLIGVILLVRNLKAEKIPGDELCDLDHVDDEGVFYTEAELLEMQEAEAAATKA